MMVLIQGVVTWPARALRRSRQTKGHRAVAAYGKEERRRGGQTEDGHPCAFRHHKPWIERNVSDVHQTFVSSPRWEPPSG